VLKIIALSFLLFCRLTPSLIKVKVEVRSGSRRFKRELIKGGIDKDLAEKLASEYKKDINFLKLSNLPKLIFGFNKP